MIKGGDFKNHGGGGRKQGRKGRGGFLVFYGGKMVPA